MYIPQVSIKQITGSIITKLETKRSEGGKSGYPFDIPAKIAQSVAHLTPVQKLASLSPTGSRLTQPSIPPWVGKMSTWWMMVIGGISAFQIGSLGQLENQDMAALVLYAPQGIDLRGVTPPHKGMT